MSKVDPFDGAFPPSHHASTVMNSSNINSQLLPQNSMPMVNMALKQPFIIKTKNVINEDETERVMSPPRGGRRTIKQMG